MSRHPETSEIFFVRHAPVVKKSGHVPPTDPPIQDLDYRLEQVAAMLPQGADWHVSPLFSAHEIARSVWQRCRRAVEEETTSAVDA